MEWFLANGGGGGFFSGIWSFLTDIWINILIGALCYMVGWKMGPAIWKMLPFGKT